MAGNRWQGTLKRFLGQLFLQGDPGQATPVLSVRQGVGQSGNVFEILSPTGLSGVAAATSGNLLTMSAGATNTLTINSQITATGNITATGGVSASSVTANGNVTMNSSAVFSGSGASQIVNSSPSTSGRTLVIWNSNQAAALTNITLGSGTMSASSGQQINLGITPTYNQTGTAGSTELFVNRVETVLGSGPQNFFDFQANSVSKHTCQNDGRLFLGNVTTEPTTNPTGGGYLYCFNGTLKYMGSSGTKTVLANA